jgi:starch phosphorylase
VPEIAASVASSAESQKCHRTALTVEALARSFLDNLLFVQGRSLERATVNDLYMALAHTVRDRLVERWISTVTNYQAQDVRVVSPTTSSTSASMTKPSRRCASSASI